jgi:lipoprotein-anchoring transpeptidase ErfK/SrfK
MPRVPALRLVVPSLLLLLSTVSVQAQSRPFWETWPNFGGSDEDRPRKKKVQVQAERAAPARQKATAANPNLRTLSSSAQARAANTRTARLSRPSNDDDDDDTVPNKKASKPEAPKILEGGPRPSISGISPKPVSVTTGQQAGTIVIDTRGRQLFLMTSANSALRYPISVGRDGFTWTGTEKIARVADWPDWHPPQEMRERIPTLPEKMTGGIHNPLGAKSLYLGNSLYRIHGTNDARTIGQAASSGCFRMLNGHVVDLSNRVGVGTKVVVLPHLGAQATKTAAPESTSGSKPKPQAQAPKPRTAG